MVNLIAFNGKMGVGKSEAVKMLMESNYKVVLVKFAQPLYDIQEYIYSRIESVYKRPENFIKDRKLLQWVGTDWGRETISQSIWVDIWKAEVKRLMACGFIVVCDDVRFDNEAQVIKDLDGYLISIVSDRSSERIDTVSGLKNHASEAGINAEFINTIVENNGTLQDYKSSLSYLYRRLGVSDDPTEYVTQW